MSPFDENTAITAGRFATAIAQEFFNARIPKKHGEYLVYDDDKIIISLDSYFPNLSVYIKDGGESRPFKGQHGIDDSGGVTRVLERPGDQKPVQFRDGLWVDYIVGLGQKALSKRREYQKNAAKVKLSQLQHSNRPVDDEALFKVTA